MSQTIGKISGVDIIKKKVIIEVDKSQSRLFDNVNYCPVIFDSGKQVMLILLKKDADKLTFYIDFTNDGKNIWDYVRQCIGDNINIIPKNDYLTTVNNPITVAIKIDDLDELIIT